MWSIQVFPCCWHVNVLMQKSNLLTTAMYSCNWMDQNQEFRKMLIIFMQRSQKTNTILAGNLAPVTLQTFLAVRCILLFWLFSLFLLKIQMFICRYYAFRFQCLRFLVKCKYIRTYICMYIITSWWLYADMLPRNWQFLSQYKLIMANNIKMMQALFGKVISVWKQLVSFTRLELHS